jgi:flagellar motor switch protein FliG
LIIALKNSDEKIKQKFMDNMSTNGAGLFRYNLETNRKEISIEEEAEARHEIVTIMRLLMKTTTC